MRLYSTDPLSKLTFIGYTWLPTDQNHKLICEGLFVVFEWYTTLLYAPGVELVSIVIGNRTLISSLYRLVMLVIFVLLSKYPAKLRVFSTI